MSSGPRTPPSNPSPDEVERVGVREIRQNLSVHLRRVKAGETIEVTERGVPVARLVPIKPAPKSIIEQGIEEGWITPPAWWPDGPRTPLPPPKARPPGTPPLSQTLREMRDEERF